MIASETAYKDAGALLRKLQRKLLPSETITMRYDENVKSFVYTKSSDRLYYFHQSAIELKHTKETLDTIAIRISYLWQEMSCE